MTDRLFYVGTPGRMVALPDVLGEVDTPTERIGGSGRSLTGREWRDTLGFRRSWSWKFEHLLPEQVPYVESLIEGSVRGPLRLVDPRRANRLPQQVAAGGSPSRSTRGFAVTVGGLRYRDLLDLDADPATLPAAALLRGAVEWQRPTGGAGVLYLSGATLDGAWRLPVVRDEPLELSCWACGVAGAQLDLAWVEYNRAGVGAGYTSAATTDSITLSSSEWRLLTVNVQPAPTSVELTPRLSMGAAAVPGSVFTTAWQIAALDAERRPAGMTVACPVPELSGGWRPGGGSPFVVADPAGASYPAAPGFRNLGLTLIETSG